jgi:hypothetical protein
MIHRMLAIGTTLGTIGIGLLGVGSGSLAQQPQPSAGASAALLGVQERSLQTQPKSTVDTSQPVRETPVSEPQPLTLYRLDAQTRVILAPAKASTDPMAIPVDGATGNNRVQLQHDIQP